jgi:O-antigen ligase
MYSGPAIALGSLARVLLFGLSLYVFVYVAHGPGVVDEGSIRLLFLAGAVSAAFACADFYSQWPPLADFGQQFVWLPAGMYRRAQGVFYEAGTLGNLCAFFLVLVATALFRRAPISRPVLLAGGAVFAAALLLSFSRSSLLNLAAAVAALLWLHRRGFRWRRPALVLAASAAAALVILYAVFPAFVEFYGRRWWATLQLWAFPEITLAGRLQSWATLVDFLAENPWHAVLGIGYKTLPQTSFLGRPLIADNMYLSVLVETGLLGLAALAVFLAAILRCSWRLARHADAQISLLGAWSFCFWVGQLVQMLSVDLLTYWRVLPLYFFVLAMAVRLARRTPDA